jgi:D-alanyl-D-alanine carboxypeptidase
MKFVSIIGLVLLMGLLWGCQPSATASLPVPVAAEMVEATAVPPTTIPPTITQSAPATPTAVPTITASPTPAATATPTVTPTATPIGPCDQRIPVDDLLTFVTLTYGLSRDYQPGDLVPLTDYFANDVTLGYPTEVRQIIIDPLVQMIGDMQAAGMAPFIVSGFRSYSQQAIAWDKWNRTYPETAAIVSSPPGHSEHQLGTTLDFGSPELPDVVGEEDIEFHTYFYKTSEGTWLRENAHKYGFTLSYSREAFDVTGFYYEPWHFRYVGVELAAELYESGNFLAQYLLDTQPLPCVP